MQDSLQNGEMKFGEFLNEIADSAEPLKNGSIYFMMTEKIWEIFDKLIQAEDTEPSLQERINGPFFLTGNAIYV